MMPDYWETAKTVLSEHDPVMAEIIARYQGEGLRTRGEAFHTLARSIVGQQISVKAADAVWAKLEQAALPLTLTLSPGRGDVQAAESQENRKPSPWGEGGVRGLSAEHIFMLSEEALRACGLSRQKIVYLKAIAEHFSVKNIHSGYFDLFSDEEIIKELVSIKGIGKWTAEMFLIFHLMRPDVFPVDDIGVQKAIERHYHHSVMPSNGGVRTPSFDGVTKKEYYRILNEHAERWRPYRSVATWYLWRALDPVPVEY